MLTFPTRSFRVCMWRYITPTTGTPYCSSIRSVFPPHTTSNTTTCTVRVVHVAFATFVAQFTALHAKLGSTLRVIGLEPTHILVVRYVQVVEVIALWNIASLIDLSSGSKRITYSYEPKRIWCFGRLIRQFVYSLTLPLWPSHPESSESGTYLIAGSPEICDRYVDMSPALLFESQIC